MCEFSKVAFGSQLGAVANCILLLCLHSVSLHPHLHPICSLALLLQTYFGSDSAFCLRWSSKCCLIWQRCWVIAPAPGYRLSDRKLFLPSFQSRRVAFLCQGETFSKPLCWVGTFGQKCATGKRRVCAHLVAAEFIVVGQHFSDS